MVGVKEPWTIFKNLRWLPRSAISWRQINQFPLFKLGSYQISVEEKKCHEKVMWEAYNN